MAEEIGLVTLTLDRVILRRASLNDLYLHTKFHLNKKNYSWTDGRTTQNKTVKDDNTIQGWPHKYSWQCL